MERRANDDDDDDDDVSIPDLEYPTSPYTWERLIDVLEVRKDPALLRRSREDQIVYEQSRKARRKEWVSFSDYVRYDKFGSPRTRVEGDGRWTVVSETTSNVRKREEDQRPPPPPPQQQQHHQEEEDSTNKVVRLCRNDFPYFFEPDVEHWVLWKRNGTVNAADLRTAMDELASSSSLSDELSFLHWTNPPRLQSVPDVDHAHVLVRRVVVGADAETTSVSEAADGARIVSDRPTDSAHTPPPASVPSTTSSATKRSESDEHVR